MSVGFRQALQSASPEYAVGTVRNVRADPQNKNCPAEVEMALSYHL